MKISRRRMLRAAFAVPCGAYFWGGGFLGPPKLYAANLRQQDGFAALLPRSEGPDPFLAENMVRARLAQAEIAGVKTRIERIEGKFAVLVEEIFIVKANQVEIDRRIDYLCQNEERLEEALEETVLAVRSVAERAEALGIRLDAHNQDLSSLSAELQCLQSNLCCLSRLLCGLTERIRRAEFRAFIVGVLVGIGIGAAIGGGGGGGAIASVGVW